MSNDDPSLSNYRPCVGIMLINRSGQVWMGLRADALDDIEGPGDWWQMPQGGIDADEDPEAAALRELKEETGVISAEVIARTRGWLRYDLPPDIAPKAWGGRYRGQKQIWFALRFTGCDSQINIDPPAGLDHKKEFLRWEWTDPDQVVNRVVAFKRDVYRAVMAELQQYAKPDAS